ncbi:TPM domain-containing protein [Rhodoferax sp.]|uniref:TPM domain-containing protein n=1 Tax=Rhodoferax sp. TaxID=50421 RepID=UPI0025DF8391|nr:TPM domain-containing protein [Rhodoferax sp.]
MWKHLLRILGHCCWDVRDVRRTVPSALLERLSLRVSASEQRHTGEIRICVEAGLPLSYLWRNASARERAVMLFGKLRVWDTEHNNGVLIYLLLADHAIELVADRGVNARVSPLEWQAMVAHLGTALQAGQVEEGLTTALEEVSAVLAQHFPLLPGDVRGNELPNAPVLVD